MAAKLGNKVVRLRAPATPHLGQLDVWVNGTEIHMPGRFEDLPLEGFRRVMDVGGMGRMTSRALTMTAAMKAVPLGIYVWRKMGAQSA